MKHRKARPLGEVLESMQREEDEAKARHRRRHQELHRALDELMADWAQHNSNPHDPNLKLFSNTTISQLMEWSYRQTVDPDEIRGEES